MRRKKIHAENVYEKSAQEVICKLKYTKATHFFSVAKAFFVVET
jgi:hypothetical protein